jgi:hypothetical protein
LHVAPEPHGDAVGTDQEKRVEQEEVEAVLDDIHEEVDVYAPEISDQIDAYDRQRETLLYTMEALLKSSESYRFVR